MACDQSQRVTIPKLCYAANRKPDDAGITWALTQACMHARYVELSEVHMRERSCKDKGEDERNIWLLLLISAPMQTQRRATPCLHDWAQQKLHRNHRRARSRHVQWSLRLIAARQWVPVSKQQAQTCMQRMWRNCNRVASSLDSPVHACDRSQRPGCRLSVALHAIVGQRHPSSWLSVP